MPFVSIIATALFVVVDLNFTLQLTAIKFYLAITCVLKDKLVPSVVSLLFFFNCNTLKLIKFGKFYYFSIFHLFLTILKNVKCQWFSFRFSCGKLFYT